MSEIVFGFSEQAKLQAIALLKPRSSHEVVKTYK
jgi:hypothetical protein